MSAEVTETIRMSLKQELARIEQVTDLSKMTILSRTGMRIATSQSHEIDADPITASSAALIDVGIRFNTNVKHGGLREVLIRADGGYAILMYIDNEYMTFAGLQNLARIGYYLEFLRIKCRHFSYLLAGGVMTQELKSEIETDKNKEIQADSDMLSMFESDRSSDQDMDAMKDVLDFLNDWGGDDAAPVEAGNVDIGIDAEFMIGEDILPDEMGSIGIPKEEKPTPVKEFPVYDDEVPPIPLEEVEALELGTAGQTEDNLPEEQIIESVAEQIAETQAPASPPALDPNAVPDFDALSASEYDDVDLDLSEEEAMFEALEDLGYVDKKKKD